MTTKDKILQAALKILEDNGIKALSQPAVAKLADIPQGQLTYHFPKRTDLILAVANLSMTRISEFVFKQGAKVTGDSTEKIQQLLWDLVKDHSRARTMLGLVIEADENIDVQEMFKLQEQRVRALISTAIGTEEDHSKVTLIHATMLGFGLLSFMRGSNQKNLHKDFLFALKNIREISTNDKTKKGK
ncbi:MAG: TetR/AcrR family transcriptional regulator [Pseudobdellovibrio sp.]